MGQRRDRFDKRRANQIATRRKNSIRKEKERVRRVARLEARAAASAASDES